MGFIATGGGAISGGGMYGGGGSYGGGMVSGGGMYGGGAVVGGGVGMGMGGGGIIAPGGPGGAFAERGVLFGKDVNYDGVIQPREMGFIGTGGVVTGGGMDNQISDAEADACIRTVTTYKTVAVPVTRNKYRVVNYSVPQTVPYTDYQTVTRTRTITKQVPKTIIVPVQTQEPFQTSVPVTRQKTIMVPKSRTTCTPETKIVSRRVPVVNVVPKPPPPCPPQMM